MTRFFLALFSFPRDPGESLVGKGSVSRIAALLYPAYAG